MALASRVVHAAAGVGIDESTSAELLDFGRANLAAKNVRHSKRGALEKRLGYGYLTSTRMDASSRSAGYRLMAYGDRLCTIDGTRIDSYSPAAAAWTVDASWPHQDYVPELLNKRITMPYPGTNPKVVDVALANGFLVVASVGFDSSLTLYLTASVLDASTYTLVRHDVIEVGASMGDPDMKLCAVGSHVLIFFVSSTANTINGRRLDCTSRSTIDSGWSIAAAMTSTAAVVNGVTPFDVVGLSDRFVLVHALSAGTNRLQVFSKDTDTSFTTLQSTTVNTSSTTPSALCVAGASGDTVWVGWSETTAGKVIGLSPSTISSVTVTAGTAITATATIDQCGIAITAAGKCVFVVGTIAAGAYATIYRDVDGSGGSVTTPGSAITYRGCLMSARPFVLGGRRYCSVVPVRPTDGEPDTNKSHFIVELYDISALGVVSVAYPARVAANLAARQSVLGVGETLVPPHVVALSATQVGVLGVTERSSLNLTTGASLELNVLDSASATRWAPAELSGTLYLSGGVPALYDGQRVQEANFLCRPDTPTVADGGAGGVTLTAVKYLVIWEKVDAAGNVHWSAPSDASNQITIASRQVTVTIYPLTFTGLHLPSSGEKVRAAVYRSSSNGVAPWYRVGTVDNDPGVASFTFTDTQATVTSNAKLYRQPGLVGTEQQHQCPPCLRLLTVYNEMLCGIADDGVTLWYTPQRIVGEAPWWNDVFQLPLLEGGEVTALAAQDGALYAFKRRSIFALSGAAPSGNGTQGGFSDPRRVAADVGCIDPRSVCVTELGIFFQSERGIELLTRAQSVQYIGEPVTDTLASYPVITSAVLDSEAGLVRFTCAASETANQVSAAGVHLVFDLTIKAWVSVDEVRTANGATRAAQDACIAYVQGAYRYCWLDKDGTVQYEQSADHASAYLDHAGSYWVTKTWEPANFKSGLLQEQRVFNAQLLLEPGSAAGIKIECGYDFGAYSASDDKTWAEAAVLNQRKLELRPKSLRHAVRFRVTDTQPATLGTGKGPTFVGISIDTAPKQGSTQGTPRVDTGLRR